MATPTLSVTNWADIEDCDAVTGFSNIAGGSGVALNQDVFRQGIGAVGRRIDNSTNKGFSYDMGTASTLQIAQSQQVVNGTTPAEWNHRIGFWFNTLQPTLITNFRFGASSGTSPATQRWEHQLIPNNTYNGGWVHFCVDVRLPYTDNLSGFDTGLDGIRQLTFVWDMQNVGGTLNNCIVDSIRHGTGITVTGGSTSDKVTWDDVEAVGNSITNAYGLIQQRSGVFFMQGEWQFGVASGAGDCYFEDGGKTLIWTEATSEDSQTTPNDFQVAGNEFHRLIVKEGTGTTDFINGTKVGTGDTASGVGGCTYQAQVSSLAGQNFQQNTLEMNFSDAAVTNVELYGCVFTRCLGALDKPGSLSFSDDATNGPNHEVMGCVFDGCGRIEPGRVVMRNNTFSNTRQSNQATGYFDYVAARDEAHSVWNVATSNIQDFDPATQDEMLLRDGTGDHTNSSVYFGYRDQFGAFAFMSNTSFGNHVWEYWDGSAWSSLTLTLLPNAEMNWDTDQFIPPTQATRVGGVNAMTGYLDFTIPSDWEKTVVNTSENLYFIRYRETDNSLQSGQEFVIAFAHPMHAPNGAAFNWASNVNIKNSSFISNADADSGEKAHGVEHEVEGTFAYTGLNFSGNDADILFSDPSTLVDEYDFANGDTSEVVGNGTINGVGQSITGDGTKLTRAAFNMLKTGTPTGNAVARLYAHSGTFGTSSVPTGAALAVSANFDVSTLTGSFAEVEFVFTDHFLMVNTTKYVIAVEYTGGDGSNNITVESDTSSPSHGGNMSQLNGSWAAESGTDLVFKIWSGELIINASDGAPATSTVICKGSVKINNTVNVTLTGLITSPATEVRVYEAGTTTEIDGVEDEASGSFIFSAEASSDVDIIIHNVEYVPIRIESFTIPSTAVSIPISMRFDRNYSNP
jgi:hypothetical protein